MGTPVPARRAMRDWSRRTRVVVGLVLVLLLALLLVVMFRERVTRSLLFYPERGQSHNPGAVGLAYEEVWLVAEDGVRTQAWWIPGRGDQTLIYFHGNAGTMSSRLPDARAMHDRGLSLLLAEYRGYGDSEGEPSEVGLYRDATAALAEARRRAPESTLIVFGRSLGGAVAIDLAAREPVDAVIVESTFTSLPQVARGVFPIPGLQYLVAYRLDSLAKIAAVRAPMLIIHGGDDELIPVSMAEELATANPEAHLVVIPGGRHNDTPSVGGAQYDRAWREFLGSLKQPR